MNKDSDFTSLIAGDVLTVGSTYFIKKLVREPGPKHYHYEYTPVTIEKQGRKGDYGNRVIGSDGKSRYSDGYHVGKHRAYETRDYDLHCKLKTGAKYIAPSIPRPPQVQLDLFDLV